MTSRQSTRLFKDFVKERASKNVDEIVSWIHVKMNLVKETSDYTDKERIVCEIYCTILHYEPEVIFRDEQLTDAMINKLDEFIDRPPQKAVSWAKGMKKELLQTTNRRFNNRFETFRKKLRLDENTNLLAFESRIRA